ncbi:MAG: PQQ-binding-like beta-propeller repeat protein [Prosthecobacter sp.]
MKALHCLLLTAALLTAARADWPTYLHDNSRVGHTEEALKAPLASRWEYVSPSAPQMAWAGEDGRVVEGMELFNRVRFDDAFHVAISGGRVFFGSTVDGRVQCRDLATGKEEWAFFTNGPVRLAPTISDGRVYVGSDDGYAYCLDAKSGALVWKLRAGPNDERILARGRMISRWPVRTGLLINDGSAYFGAGVFPHENIFLYAVDATTGKVQWKNDAISQEDAGRNDLSPQGYLLATKELLFVPSGRALSVAFDRKTGKQVNKPTPGWRGDAGGQIGGTQAMLVDDQILAVGEHQILSLDQKTGKTGYAWFLGTQMTMTGNAGFMATGKDIVAIDREKHAEGTRERHAIEMAATKISGDLRKHAALTELKKVAKIEAEIKAAKPAEVEALQKALTTAAQKYEPLRLDYQTKKDKLAEHKQRLSEMKDIGIKWRWPSAHESALIHAGGTLVVGGKNEVVCLDVETGKPLWKSKVEGEARGLAVSDGHLIVSTTAGRVYAFADASRGNMPALAEISKIDADPFPKDTLSDIYAAAAEEILKATKVKHGFCLVLGSEQGRLAYEIAKRSDLSVFGVEPDEAKVKSSREALLRTGLYGSRISIDHLDLSMVPYSSFFANLVVSDSLLLTGNVPGIPVEVARTLKPIGGVICLGAVGKETNAAEWLASTKLTDEKATITKSGDWTLLTRAALPGADSWSHQYGNAANTSSNNDQRVKGGLNVLWYGDPGPGESVNRHDGAVGPLSVNGRLFTQGEKSIQAHDAFNGQFLWEVKNPGAMRIGVFNSREPGNMAASDDYLFMLLEDKCLQFDAATGKTVRELKIPGDSKPNLEWGYIAYYEGLLYGTVTQRVENASEQARRGKSASISTDTLFAYDVKTGVLKWTYQGKYISHVSIAIGDGRVYFIDATLTPAQREVLLKEDKTELAKLTGKARDIAEERTKKADLRLAVALDAKQGTQLWAKPVDVTDCSEIGIGGGALTMMYQNGHLVLGGANANGHYWEQFLSGEFARRRLVVLDAVKGEKIGAKDANYRNRPIVINNEIIAEPWAYDLYTGEQKMRTHPLTGEKSPWMFARPGHHCGALSASANMMFFRSKSTAYYNMDEDKGTEHFAGQRLGCWINTIPANGLVMVPEASAGCVCLFSIASTIVFEPRADRMSWGVYSANGATTPVQHMALNFGAPGDRRDAHGKLWLGYPRPSSRAGIDLPLDLKHSFAKGGEFYAFNEESYKITATENPWIFTSGARGLAHAELPLIGKGQKSETYTVRLYFAAPEGDKPGQRVFDVQLQGKTVMKALDVTVKTGGAKHALIEEFERIAVTDNLLLELVPAQTNPDVAYQPVLCGIEVLRTDAKEIKGGVAER